MEKFEKIQDRLMWICELKSEKKAGKTGSTTVGGNQSRNHLIKSKTTVSNLEIVIIIQKAHSDSPLWKQGKQKI